MLPEVFCWSKFGVESGEDPEDIIERKEQERQANGGVFLWGIGNSIVPSIQKAQETSDTIEALFTPMLSRPAAHDVSPEAVVEWRLATGFDGSPFNIPAGSRVTSRLGGRGAVPKHFALICYSDTDLRERAGNLSFEPDSVCNYLTGNRVGASQVTSIVKKRAGEDGTVGRYEVAFRATLIYPFVAMLSSPVETSIGSSALLHASFASLNGYAEGCVASDNMALF